MIVVFTIDDIYVQPISTVIQSLVSSEPELKKIYIVGRLSNSHQEGYLPLLRDAHPHVEIIYLCAFKSMERMGVKFHHPCMDRLLIPECVPERKVIFSDADVIFNNSIKRIWETQTEPLGIAALTSGPGCFTEWIHHSTGKKEMKYIYSKKFDAGLIVMDLDKMQCLNFVKEIPHICKQINVNDMITFNLWAAGHYTPIDRSDVVYLSDDLPPDEKWNFDSKAIIHYTNSPKPWERDEKSLAKIKDADKKKYEYFQQYWDKYEIAFN